MRTRWAKWSMSSAGRHEPPAEVLYDEKQSRGLGLPDHRGSLNETPGDLGHSSRPAGGDAGRMHVRLANADGGPDTDVDANRGCHADSYARAGPNPDSRSHAD